MSDDNPFNCNLRLTALSNIRLILTIEKTELEKLLKSYSDFNGDGKLNLYRITKMINQITEIVEPK